MAAFLIADIAVKNAAGYREYVEGVPALVERHGGKYRVRDGDHELLEHRSRRGRR
jgi:uncharacterized protein (DUF1330 family)